MREIKETAIEIEIAVQGKTVKLTQNVSNHDLEDQMIALVNTALLLEQNLNEWVEFMRCPRCDSDEVHTVTAGEDAAVFCMECGATSIIH